MALDRPTFSETWYRIAPLRPRLRASVHVYRQHFRGRMWHVIEDPASNQFFRLNDPAYRFVGLLEGKRTVEEAWHIVTERLGDEAPTQGEVTTLLAQLHNANLLYSQLPADTEALFRRYRRRRSREVRGWLTNFLFIRIPLLDPDRFLNRWLPVFGWIFSPVGFGLWILLVGIAAISLVQHTGDLLSGASGVLAPANLPYLYVAFALLKLVHEFGHGFACKRYGTRQGSGGEVHVMGIMLLVFMPVPYVDASSAWALRQKWSRVVVSAAGMYVELAMAAIAALVWLQTNPGSAINAIAYNMIFAAGVTTLLFNANPLLRYDGYYILADVLETPNLQQRSKEQMYYVVQRFIWGKRDAIEAAHHPGEAALLAVYGVLSAIYRVFIAVVIVLFIAGQLFFLGLLLAIGAIVTMLLVPAVRFLQFLLTGPSLQRCRPRALLTTTLALLVMGGVLGLVPVPDRVRLQGVVEPQQLLVVRAETSGFIEEIKADGARISDPDEALVVLSNRQLEATYQQHRARRARSELQRRIALVSDVARAQIEAEKLHAIDEQMTSIEQRLDALQIHPSFPGVWSSPRAAEMVGRFIRRGDELGALLDPGTMIIRAVAGQDHAGQIASESEVHAEFRVFGQGAMSQPATLKRILPAGTSDLPSAALGYLAGGATITRTDDRSGSRTLEPVFEVQLLPHQAGDLRPGQRVVIRIELQPKPLVQQGWRTLHQLVQRRVELPS